MREAVVERRRGYIVAQDRAAQSIEKQLVALPGGRCSLVDEDFGQARIGGKAGIQLAHEFDQRQAVRAADLVVVGGQGSQQSALVFLAEQDAAARVNVADLGDAVAGRFHAVNAIIVPARAEQPEDRFGPVEEVRRIQRDDIGGHIGQQAGGQHGQMTAQAVPGEGNAMARTQQRNPGALPGIDAGIGKDADFDEMPLQQARRVIDRAVRLVEIDGLEPVEFLFGVLDGLPGGSEELFDVAEGLDRLGRGIAVEADARVGNQQVVQQFHAERLGAAETDDQTAALPVAKQGGTETTAVSVVRLVEKFVA